MLEAMTREIVLTLPQSAGRREVSSVYFGGGTPSILAVAELELLLKTVAQCSLLVPDAEIAIEANPDDLSDEYLSGLRRIGFNRLSIGAQSFFDDDLRWMNRRHDARQALQSVEAARRQGFRNINIDLMYGFSAMTRERLEANLKQALALDAPHLSVYHLVIEPRTAFEKRQDEGETLVVSDDESARQLDVVIDTLETAGYEHYEISNFARPGFRSRQNLAYWQLEHYAGIGPAAHSYDGRTRRWNVDDNGKYIAAIENGADWFERERLTVAEHYNEYVLVSMRAAWGADIAHIRATFGNAFADGFLRQAAVERQNGNLTEKNGIFTLTRKGKMLADRVASDLFC